MATYRTVLFRFLFGRLDSEAGSAIEASWGEDGVAEVEPLASGPTTDVIAEVVTLFSVDEFDLDPAVSGDSVDSIAR